MPKTVHVLRQLAGISKRTLPAIAAGTTEEEIAPTKALKSPYTHRMFVQRGTRTDEALSIDRRDDRILAEWKT